MKTEESKTGTSVKKASADGYNESSFPVTYTARRSAATGITFPQSRNNSSRSSLKPIIGAISHSQPLLIGTREPGEVGGGGAVGATCPPTLDCRCRSFLFLVVFARELGSLPKNSGQIQEVFSFGQGLPWTPGDVCTPPPPPNFKVVPASLVAECEARSISVPHHASHRPGIASDGCCPLPPRRCCPLFSTRSCGGRCRRGAAAAAASSPVVGRRPAAAWRRPAGWSTPCTGPWSGSGRPPLPAPDGPTVN